MPAIRNCATAAINIAISPFRTSGKISTSTRGREEGGLAGPLMPSGGKEKGPLDDEVAMSAVGDDDDHVSVSCRLRCKWE